MKIRLSAYQVFVVELLETRDRYIKTSAAGFYYIVEADGSTIVKRLVKKSVEAMERMSILKRDHHDNLSL